jgi:hypothetical protein
MTVADQQPAVRYLVKVEELSPGLLACTLLHTVTNHSMDLKPLEGVVTVAVNSAAYDDLVVLRAKGATAVIDIEDGIVVRAVSVAEACVRPAQKLVLRLEEGRLNIYAGIYAARARLEPLRRTLLSVRHHWSHFLDGRKHIMAASDAIRVDSSHCGECARIDLLRGAPCKSCLEAGHAWLYDLQPGILAMLKLSLEGIDAGGAFTSRVDAQGCMQIQTAKTIVKTDLFDIQRLLERAVIGGR